MVSLNLDQINLDRINLAITNLAITNLAMTNLAKKTLPLGRASFKTHGRVYCTSVLNQGEDAADWAYEEPEEVMEVKLPIKTLTN